MSSMQFLQIFTFHYVSILIQKRLIGITDAVFFTFHYVSILIRSLLIPASTLDHFTFHYVSILITAAQADAGKLSALHSIMSLF